MREVLRVALTSIAFPAARKPRRISSKRSLITEHVLSGTACFRRLRHSDVRSEVNSRTIGLTLKRRIRADPCLPRRQNEGESRGIYGVLIYREVASREATSTDVLDQLLRDHTIESSWRNELAIAESVRNCRKIMKRASNPLL